MIRTNRQHPTWSMSHDTTFAALLAGGLSPEALHAAVAAQRVEIVLTAHPTQVNRRTCVPRCSTALHCCARQTMDVAACLRVLTIRYASAGT